MARSVTTFLMFEGRAGEAIDFYISLFPGSSVQSIERWGPGEPGPAGGVKQAYFTVAGLPLRAFDSPVSHGFTFTPAISLFVACDGEAEMEATFARLSAGGQVLMPPDDYGFSRRFCWVQDRFGVSWQLDVAR
jgi:predicted 3-demethylubiquinone-9 3-methyltransferase (glyoxalase superfamily)